MKFELLKCDLGHPMWVDVDAEMLAALAAELHVDHCPWCDLDADSRFAHETAIPMPYQTKTPPNPRHRHHVGVARRSAMSSWA